MSRLLLSLFLLAVFTAATLLEPVLGRPLAPAAGLLEPPPAPTPNTTYHYRVVTADAAGNASTSITRSFTTLP